MPQLPFSFQPYGLFIALGFVFLYVYCFKNLDKFSLNKDSYNQLFVVLLFSSLIGARVYHVLSWLSYYKIFPIEILFIWNGGLGIFGALIGGFLGVLVFSRLKKLNMQNILNLLAPPLLLVQSIGRLGNFFNHEGFGPPSKLPWAVYIPVSSRPIKYLDESFFHPTFFYESLLCLLFFAFFLYAKNKFLKKDSFLNYYLVSYGIIRLITENLRLDTWRWQGFGAGYFFSFLMIFLGIILEIAKNRKTKKTQVFKTLNQKNQN